MAVSQLASADNYHYHQYQTYRYCDYKVVVTNSSDKVIQIYEGWIWPFTSKRQIEPYGSNTKCMFFGHVASLKLEYFDPSQGVFLEIPGCPKSFYAPHSFKITVKNRDKSEVPYCKLG